ncbi:EH signature domain-containing protein [Arenicella xantha]|uniref:EH signature protein n=1 Tax=Arenicella xantha TaxID=644221 RepID=A0A395JR03_9GAMM|nr:EH signature domain-containing protein [Arenicella xantha]RBP52985.1 EH signature protein [Arenicella xantha]
MPLPTSLWKGSNVIEETWSSFAFDKLKKNEKKLVALAQSAGQGSDRYKAARSELERHIAHGLDNHLHIKIVSFFHAKAILDIIREAESLTNIQLDTNLIQSLKLDEDTISKITLLNLISVYFEKYDSIRQQGNILHLSVFIAESLKILNESQNVTQLSKFKAQSSVLFNSDAPKMIVQRAIDQDIELTAVFKEMGLRHVISGEFTQLCSSLYYLEKLQTIPLGEPHRVLEEVCSESVSKLSIDEHKRVGHAALEILIERSSASGISEFWLDTILSIASDPRVLKTSESYQRWWAHLDQNLVAKVRGWMSKVDLKLFLDILEQSATDEDMRRMYADRKTVIEGLDKLGVIDESRLFLSRQAELHLKRMKDLDRLPNYKKVNDAKTSMIYLKIGSKHIIEGTHSFKLKVMDQVPSKLPIMDFSKSAVDLSDFRGQGFKTMWIKEFATKLGYIEKTHAVNLSWVNDLLEELRKANIDVTEADIVPREKMQWFIRKYGKRSRLRGIWQ